MASRVDNIAHHVKSGSAVEAIKQKHPDDVVIVAAYRSAITRAKKGGFAQVPSAEILSGLLEGVLERTKIDPKLLDDVAIGNVLNPGAGSAEHRAAALYAGIPYTASFVGINRQCSSGLMAVNDIAMKIRNGQINAGVGGGVESMTQNYGKVTSQGTFPGKFGDNEEAAACQIPMGVTSENVATKYHLGRQVLDKFAAGSYEKAAKAQDAGQFKPEIVPIKVSFEDKDGNEKEVVVDTDDGIRRGVTADSLGKLRPAFDEDGTTTAGNASQVSDGAGAVILARRSFAEKNGWPIVGKFVHCRVVGVPPDIMGVGPAYAIPAVLEDVGLTVNDIDVFEINEAFASQCYFSIVHCKIPEDKVNPRGGAIAFGHPLGATGARQVATLLSELKDLNKWIGVTSMCIGTGMGAAAVFVRE